MVAQRSGAGTMSTDELLEAAAALSRRFGGDPGFSRAGGGNSSVKADGVLYIKPSGVSLASITAASLMPLAAGAAPRAGRWLGRRCAPGSDVVMASAMAARLRDEGDRRPSVECVFHALIESRFVIHTHPTLVNALTCARDGEAIAAELFGDDVLWVPYVDPGLPLALEIARRRRAHVERTGAAAPAVTLLQNHGLIVAGDDPAVIVERSVATVDTVRRRLDALPPAPSAGRAPDADVVALISRAVAARFATARGPRAVGFDGSPESGGWPRPPRGASSSVAAR